MTTSRGSDVHPDAEFEPLSSPVPVPLTPLVGRSQAIDQLSGLLFDPDIRLITLTGPGGVGKTRLALAVAPHVGDHFVDGIVYVSLAEIDHHSLVLNEIGKALRLREVGIEHNVEYLSHVLQRRRILLILDNLEHVRQAASQIVRILSNCPELQVLTTSRVSLRVHGEHEVAVSPLSVEVPACSDQEESDAVRLFAQRAASVRAGFSVTDSNRPDIVEICRRLDGIPLAIELAAARISLLSPAALRSRLSSQMSILASDALDVPPRQRTLRDTISWSYSLLSDVEQQFFARMAVFSGGWTLEACEAVEGGDLGIDVLDGMATLVNHHLVQSVEYPDGSVRFNMLETIGEFAAGKLCECGDEARARINHVEYMLKTAEATATMLRGAGVVQAIDILEIEHDNMRAALEWAIANEKTDHALRLADALHWFWWTQNYFLEGRRWLEQVLTLPGGSTAARASALVAAGAVTLRNGSPEVAVEILRESLDITDREHGVPEPESRRYALFHLAYSESVRGRLQEAIQLFREAEERCKCHGDVWGQSLSLCYLGYALSQAGDFDAARSSLENALQLGMQIGSEPRISMSLSHLGFIAQAAGDIDTALDRYREAFDCAWTRRDAANLAEFLLNLASVLVMDGNFTQATRFFGAVESAAMVSSYHIYQQRFADYSRVTAEARTALGDDAFKEAWSEGAALDHQAIIDELRDVLGTGTPASSSVLAPTVSAAMPNGTHLTPRELEILSLLAEGHTTPQIADKLFISGHTVKRHVNNILAKLNVSSRSTAVAYAYRHNLIA